MKKNIVALLITSLLMLTSGVYIYADSHGTTVSKTVYGPAVVNKTIKKAPVTKAISSEACSVYKQDVVTPRKDYTYDIMEKQIQKLGKGYPYKLKIMTIGKSVLGKNIYALAIGNGANKVIYTASTHARENITSVLLMEYAELLLKKSHIYRTKGVTTKLWGNYDANALLKKTTVYIIPMVNPDGVDIVYRGVPKTHPYYKEISKMRKSKRGYINWKANARGIDLNRNYDWKWGKIKHKRPGYSGAKGTCAESEPESRAVAAFIRKILPSVVYNYHAMGNIIYSSGLSNPAVQKLGKVISKGSNYPIKKPSNNCGGCTDYIVGKWKGNILAYTVEVGSGDVPVNIKQYSSIWKRNYSVLTLGAAYKTSLYK